MSAACGGDRQGEPHAAPRQFEETRPAGPPLRPDRRTESVADPLVKAHVLPRRLAKAEVPVSVPEIGAKLLYHRLQTDAASPPRQFPELFHEQDHADGASRHRGTSGRGKENPRNVRSPGGATPLFALLTFSLSRLVMKRVRLAIPRCPARWLRP